MSGEEAYWAGLGPEDFQGEACCECGGIGWVTADCFEDTCCCEDPETEHGTVPCPACHNREMPS